MEVLKIAAALMLVLLLAAAGWTLTHWRKIKRELVSDDLMPQPIPGENLLLLLTVAFLGLSGLLCAFLLH